MKKRKMLLGMIFCSLLITLKADLPGGIAHSSSGTSSSNPSSGGGFPGAIAGPTKTPKYDSSWHPEHLGKQISVDPHSLLANKDYADGCENLRLLSKGIWEYLVKNFQVNTTIDYATTKFPTGKGLGYLPLARDSIYSDFTTFFGYMNNGLSQSVTHYEVGAKNSSIGSSSTGSQATLTLPGYKDLFTKLLTVVAEFTPENSKLGGDLPILFVDGSGLVEALTDIKNFSLYYLKGRTSLITPLSYATPNSIKFLGNGYFDPSKNVSGLNGSGVLTGIYQTSLTPSSTQSPLLQLQTFVQSFAINSSNQLFGIDLSSLDTKSLANYQNVINTFTYEVASVIANWGEGLISDLAQIYNPQLFVIGNGQTSLKGAGITSQVPSSLLDQALQQDPNIQLLDCYGQLVIDATHQLATLAPTLNKGASVGIYAFINLSSTGDSQIPAGTTDASVTSSSAATFFGNVDIDIYTKLGQISAYMGLKNMQSARDCANGKIPQHPSSMSNDTAQTQGMITALMTAYQSFTAAAGYYAKAENGLYQQVYGSKANNLYNILNYMNTASNAFQALAQQVQSGQGTIANVINGFTKVRQQYNSVTDLFAQMGENDLSLYAQRLQAQTAIMEYQQVLASTVMAYQPSVSNYIQYAIQNPFVSPFSDAFSTNAKNQQQNFQNTLVYIQQQLSGALTTYTAELNFYESLGSQITAEEKITSNNVRQAVQIFQYLSDGFSQVTFLQDSSSVNSSANDSSTGGSGNPVSPVVGSVAKAQENPPVKNGSDSIEKVTQKVSSAGNNAVVYTAQDGKTLSSIASSEKSNVQQSSTDSNKNQPSSSQNPEQASLDDILLRDGGADNKLLTVLQASGSDAIMQSIISAEDSYLKALASFKQADTLISEARSNKDLADVLNYVQIQSLFENQPTSLYALSGSNSKPTITTFTDYLFLHQARFYYYMAQELVIKKEPLAAYLFYMSVAYYSLLANGDAQSWAQENLEQVYSLLDAFLKANPSVVTSLQQNAQSIISSLSSDKTSTPEQIAQKYKAALMYYFIAFEAVADQTTIVGAYQDACKQALAFFQSQIGKSGKDMVPYPQLDAAMTSYQLYLLEANMSESGVLKTSPELTQATTLLNNFKVSYAIVPQKAGSLPVAPTPKPVDDASLDSVTLTDDQFASQSAALQNKKDATNAVRSAEILQEVLLAKFNFNDTEVSELDFAISDGNFGEDLGYLYMSYAHSKLKALQGEFASGGTYNSDKTSDLQTIANLYSQASQYYVQAGLSAQGLAALQGVSKTIAWQYYSWVIPIYQYDISQILSSAASTTQGAKPAAVIVSQTSCVQKDSDITALVDANPNWPGYVLHYNKELIPQSLITPAVNFYIGTGPTTKESILTDLVIPFKKYLFNQLVKSGKDANTNNSSQNSDQLSVSSNEQIQKLLDQYQNQVKSILAGSVKACGNKISIQGSFEVVQEKDSNGQTQTYLISNNMPIPAFPRFSGELETAYYYYTEGALKLYQSGTAPISFSGEMLLPANDIAGQNTVNRALYNAYMVSILAQESSLQNILNTSIGSLPQGSAPIYPTLQKLTNDQRIKDDPSKHPNFSDYHNFYLDVVNPLMTDMLSSYDSVVSFAQTMTGTDKDAFTAFTKKQQANKYLSWMDICKNFLLGDPTDEHYMALLNPISNFASEAQSLLIENIAPASAVPLNNQIVQSLSQVYENAGNLLMTIAAPFKHVVTNNGSTYPKAVPGMPGPYKWADAVNFYGNAVDIYIDQYQQLTSNGGMQTSSLTRKPPSDVASRLYGNLAKATYDEASFLLATFSYNAFEECKCLQGNFTDENGQSVFRYEHATDDPKATNLDTLQNLVCGANGVTYKPTSSGFYQGVAAAFTQEFKEVLQGAASGLSSIFSGDNSKSTVAITQAGDLMRRDYMLRSIGLYSSLIASGSIDSGTGAQNFPPVVSLVNLMEASNTPYLSDQQLAIKQAMSAYLAQLMTINPGFATNDQAKGDTILPVIQVPAASKTDGSASEAKNTEVSFVPIVATSSGIVELSDNNQMYLPTLQYWSSLVGTVNGKPQFGGALSDAFSKWLAKPQYLFEWTSQISFMARRLYGSAYIPGGEADMVTMNTQIDQALQNMVNNSFSTSGEYIGTGQRTPQNSSGASNVGN